MSARLRLFKKHNTAHIILSTTGSRAGPVVWRDGRGRGIRGGRGTGVRGWGASNGRARGG